MDAPQTSPFPSRVLGRTGLRAGPIALSASYGVPTEAVERGFERGANYLYWGSLRRERFARAIRNLAGQRDRMVLVVQSYAFSPRLLAWNVERALRRLRFDHADVLLLGYATAPLREPTLDAWRRLRDRGLVRFLAVSTHDRTLVPALADNPEIGIIHLRYNAAHRGAERDVFPFLKPDNRPGIVAYTATSWKQLLRSRRLPASERVPTAADCYRFVLSHPAVDVVATGPAKPQHVDEALDAAARGPMSEEELAWMRRVGDAVCGK
jgi:aryl-alcohol dehydrogenase-like predicted oxidoreductase